MKKKKYIIVIVIVFLILLGSAFLIQKRRNAASQFSKPLTKGNIIESVYGIGTVTATRSFQLKWGVTGTIHNLFVDEGDVVQTGQKIVDLDGKIFTAPFAGTITALPFKVGENVFAQSLIYALVDLQNRYIIVSLEQSGALRVQSGQKAKISFDSLRDLTFEGVVKSVYSNANNFFVRIDVQDLPTQALPGMTADVAIGIAEHQNVLLAPAVAVTDNQVSVKRKNGNVDKVDVKIGVVDGEMAEILSGDVHVGERILIPEKAGP